MPPQRKAKRAAPAPAHDIPWEQAIQNVLRSADNPLHYTEIAQRIADQGLRRAVGPTPAKIVAALLSTSLQSQESPYLRVGRGEYTLKESIQKQTKQQVSAKVADDIDETGALRAFGMFWQRALVVWSGKTRLLGRQGLGASDVNFADQVGVYLLHDRERVIYVGRATDTLFARLKAHTTDRLGGRWDRFSWFGLRSVGSDGKLLDREVPWSQDVVVETMEALLIESLEPPLNRRRGDNFSGAEYLQSSDPQIENDKRKALIAELAKAAGVD